MRRLLNLAYAVLIEQIPVELRGELDRRLSGEHEGEVQEQAPTQRKAPPREHVAAANRGAMRALIGMMPGAVTQP